MLNGFEILDGAFYQQMFDAQRVGCDGVQWVLTYRYCVHHSTCCTVFT